MKCCRVDRGSAVSAKCGSEVSIRVVRDDGAVLITSLGACLHMELGYCILSVITTLSGYLAISLSNHHQPSANMKHARTRPNMARIQNRVVSSLPDLFYLICDIMQSITIWLFLPSHQNPVDKPQTGLRIAVVGAGLTGVSAAAHCIENGADVVLLEAASKDKLGGIWARVNSTSTLQIHSLMYRFHPTVRWRQRYPNQGQILDQIRMLWSRFNLPDRTRFSTPVQSIKRHPDGGWIINNDSETLGVFDGVIASTGTCGQPMMPPIEREALFDGHICHSSELDQVDAAGKNVVIVGGGASAVEAVEFAVEKGANQIDIVSRVSRS